MQKYYSERNSSFRKKIRPNNTVICYYLIYKLITSPTFWIVKVDDSTIQLFKHIKGFRSNTERYYIVKKNVANLEKELNTKHFAVFNTNSEYIIIAETYGLRYQ